MANNISTIVGSGKTFLSISDLFVKANTNDGGSVGVVLPNSKLVFANTNSSNTAYTYIGVRLVDEGNNASVNNIIVECFEDDKINGSQLITINTNGGGGVFILLGEGQWSFQPNSTSGGGGIPTLQQVLDFNHDLVNGNNFQGTGAGAGNTGTDVIAIGTNSAFCNTGNSVTASGYYSAYCNTKGLVTASGYSSAYKNTGSCLSAFGGRSAYCNIGDNVTASGTNSAY